MNPITIGRLRISAVVERAGPTRPTWLLPDATPEALERHRAWLAPHFLDEQGRLLQSVHSFVVQAPELTALVDTCIGNEKDRGGRRPSRRRESRFGSLAPGGERGRVSRGAQDAEDGLMSSAG